MTTSEQSFDHPVVIVGGGGTGLSAALFLSALGVPALLLERHASTSVLPKAHVINQRSMEIFREHGFEHLILERGTPHDCMNTVAWYTSLGGDGPYDRRLIHKVDVRGGGRWREVYEADSPCRVGNLPQLRLEPLLRQAVEERGVASLKFNHEVREVRNVGDGVAVTYVDRATGGVRTVTAAVAIVADGGKSISQAMGIEMSGPRNLVDNMSVHFSADLSKWMHSDGALSRWLVNPQHEIGGFAAGVIVPMGPKHWDKHSEEWVFHFGLRPDDPLCKDDSPENILPRMRALMKIPELEVKVHKISHWLLEGVLADKYAIDRVVFAGDAVHRHPPSTGLGLNTGIQDAHNLAWKVAAIVKGQADPSLLASYEQERLPVGRRNVDWAMMTSMGTFLAEAAMGVIRGVGLPNAGIFERFFADTYDGAARRRQGAEILETVARREFCSHDLDLGFSYASDAVVADGTSPPASNGTGNDYVPTTRPGHRLPHVWIEADGRRQSTHDLVGRGRFVLICGEQGDAWIAAAAALAAEHRWPLSAIRTETHPDEAAWPWTVVRGIAADGALLVRPDGHVGWRCRYAPDDDPKVLLADAMRHILGLPALVGSPA